MLHQYYRQLSRRLSPGTPDSAQEAVEAVDEGPAAERECFNRHPQCDLWREKVGQRRVPPWRAGRAPPSAHWLVRELARSC